VGRKMWGERDVKKKVGALMLTLNEGKREPSSGEISF